MRKNFLLKSISLLFIIVTIIIILYAVVAMRLTGASGISRANCVGIAVICSVLAIVSWKFSNNNPEK